MLKQILKLLPAVASAVIVPYNKLTFKTKFYALPVSTPYWGMLNELGMWTMKARIVYKRIMLLQNVMMSNEERLCKQVVKDQKRLEVRKCWNKGTGRIL